MRKVLHQTPSFKLVTKSCCWIESPPLLLFQHQFLLLWGPAPLCLLTGKWMVYFSFTVSFTSNISAVLLFPFLSLLIFPDLHESSAAEVAVTKKQHILKLHLVYCRKCFLGDKLVRSRFTCSCQGSVFSVWLVRTNAALQKLSNCHTEYLFSIMVLVLVMVLLFSSFFCFFCLCC